MPDHLVRICPATDCGALNPPRRHTCRTCGDLLGGGETVPTDQLSEQVRQAGTIYVETAPLLGPCRACGREMAAEASVCLGCGTPWPTYTTEEAAVRNAPRPNRGVAAVLSLVIPGAGQMYRGHVASGLLWLVFTAVGYLLLVVPGLLLHILCVLSAARDDTEAPARVRRPLA